MHYLFRTMRVNVSRVFKKSVLFQESSRLNKARKTELPRDFSVHGCVPECKLQSRIGVLQSDLNFEKERHREFRELSNAQVLRLKYRIECVESKVVHALKNIFYIYVIIGVQSLAVVCALQ